MLYRNSFKTVVCSLGFAGVVFNPVFAFAGLTVEPLPGYETMHEECTSEGPYPVLAGDTWELVCEIKHCFIWQANGGFSQSDTLENCIVRDFNNLQLAGPEATVEAPDFSIAEPDLAVGE